MQPVAGRLSGRHKFATPLPALGPTMPGRPHLLASISRYRTLLRLTLGWLLVFASGLAVVAAAAEVFQLMAS